LIGKRLLDYLFRFDFLKELYQLGNTYLYVNRKHDQSISEAYITQLEAAPVEVGDRDDLC
jgi:hypothetical protein